MCGNRRTKEEYIQRYATCYTDGDTERAKDHAIVKACVNQIEKSSYRSTNTSEANNEIR